MQVATNANLGLSISPGGGVQTSRLSCLNANNLVLASGSQIHLVRSSRPDASNSADKWSTALIHQFSTNSTEIQSIASHSANDGTHVIASSDNFGVGNLVKITLESGDKMSDSKAFESVSSWQLSPEERTESSWTGVAINPEAATQCAIVRHIARKVSLYDGDRITRSWHTVLNPLQVSYMGPQHGAKSLLCIAENNVLSVWDDRVPNACVKRLQPSNSLLFAMATHTGLIAVGGEEKNVCIYDTRRWTVCGQMKNVLKYDIISLNFSQADSSVLYIVGLDHEILAGKWLSKKDKKAHNGNNNNGNENKDTVPETKNADEKPSKPAKIAKFGRSAFRGDSRWVGVARDATSDKLFGVTEKGTLSVVDGAALTSAFQTTDNSGEGMAVEDAM